MNHRCITVCIAGMPQVNHSAYLWYITVCITVCIAVCITGVSLVCNCRITVVSLVYHCVSLVRHCEYNCVHHLRVTGV